MEKAIWITWEKQIRNRSMSSMLGVKLYEITYCGSRLIRYVVCLIKTFHVVYKDKPKIIFAQNPSVVLNYFLIALKKIYNYKLVSDAHYGGVMAFNGSKIFQKCLDLCNKTMTLVIVTNENHAEYIKKIGGNSFVCQDPLPDIDNYYKDQDMQRKIVYFICSFDIDEPYEKVFKAAELLKKEDFTLIATGNYSKVGIDPSEYPHVEFIGYVPENEYYSKLYESSVVIDLTEHENCLVCGAYEAMAAGKPLVTSDKKCLKDYFIKGTLFTAHDEISIAETIRVAYRDRFVLMEQIRVWKNFTAVKQFEKNVEIKNLLGMC